MRTRLATAYGALPLIALACTTGLESGERQSLSQAVDGIQHQFHVSDSAVGFLPLAMAIVAIFGSVPIGILTDRTRRTTLLAGAMAIWTGCMALNGIAASFAALFLFRMGVGAVEANGPAAVSLIADYYPVEERAKRNGLYQSGALAGAMIGFVGGGLAVSWGGWHWAFLMWIPLGIAVTMLVAIQPEPRRGDQDADFETDVSNPLDVSNVRVRLPQPRRVGDLTYETARARDVYAELAKTPSFWFGTMAITISQLLLNALAFWGVPYFKRVHHMGAVAAGGVAALLGAGSAIGIIGGGFLADHYLARGVLNARVYVIAWGSIAATAVLLPAFWSTSLAVTAPLLFVGGLLLTIPVAPADAIVTDVVVPDLRGRALAIRSIVRTASTAGALLVGGLSAAFLANGWSRADSLRFAIVAITPLYAAGGLIMFLAARWYPHDVAFVAAESRRRGIAVED